MPAEGPQGLDLEDAVDLPEPAHAGQGGERLLVPSEAVLDGGAGPEDLVGRLERGEGLLGVPQAAQGDQAGGHLVALLGVVGEMGHEDREDGRVILLVADGPEHGAAGEQQHGIVLVPRGQVHDLQGRFIVLLVLYVLSYRLQGL